MKKNKIFLFLPIITTAIPLFVASCNQTVKYTVRFDFCLGQEQVYEVLVDMKSPVSKPTPKDRKNYYLTGWYLDRTYRKEWNFQDGVFSNMTLYAKWSPIYENSMCFDYNNNLGGYDVFCPFTLKERQKINITKLVIPETYDDGINGTKPVVRIGKNESETEEIGAFESFLKLNDLTIPNSVKIIGSKSFDQCQNIARINSDTDGKYNIPSNVEKICYLAFSRIMWGCEKPKEQQIVLSFPTDSKLTFLGKGAFAGSAIAKANLPSSLTTMQDSVFEECSALNAIDFPNGFKVNKLPNRTFTNCSFESFTIPDNITEIGQFCFSCNFLLKTITLNNVKKLDNYAFGSCIALNNIDLKNVTHIGESCFESCDSFTKLTFPSSITYIGPLQINQTQSEKLKTENIEFADTSSTWKIKLFKDGVPQEGYVEQNYKPDSTHKETTYKYLSSHFNESDQNCTYSWTKNEQ